MSSSNQTCYPRIAVAYNPDVQRLIRTWGDYIGLNGMRCIPCSERSEEIIFSETYEGQWIEKTWEQISDAQARFREQLWLLTIIVQGAYKMPGGTEHVDRFQHRWAANLYKVLVFSKPQSENNSDVGPPPPVNPNDAGAGGGKDPFKKPGGYDPQDPNK